MRALKRGMEITPYKCIYQEGDSKGVMVYYRINFFRPEFDKTSWDREDVRALKGLDLKQQLSSIGVYKPNMKSLVAGKECLFVKFCEQFKPSLRFLKSTTIGDTYEIHYKIMEGIYRGYCGKRRWSDLLKSQDDSNDIRILSSEQRLKWIKNKVLFACSGVRHVGQIIYYVCPKGHKRSMHTKALTQWYKNNQDRTLEYPCDTCNRGIFSGKNLADSYKDRKALVNFYITLCWIYNDHETIKYFGENASNCIGGMCVKVGYFGQNISIRSRGRHRILDERGKYLLEDGSHFVRPIERGLAFIVETFFLKKYKNYLLDRELSALGRKVDGFSEMIGFSDSNDNFSAQKAKCEVALETMKRQYLNLEHLMAAISADDARYVDLIKKSESWRRKRINGLT